MSKSFRNIRMRDPLKLSAPNKEQGTLPEEVEQMNEAKWRKTSIAKKVTDPDDYDSDSYDYHHENPRSSGMMRATSDTEPKYHSLSTRPNAQVASSGVRKGMITKQHAERLKSRIKSALAKEEVEQIDEISAETKSSYVTKAKAQVKEMQPHTKGEYRSFAKSIIAKRKAGIAMAKEEVVAEEVEKQLVKEYKIYKEKHVAWVVSHGDGHVSRFKPHEDDAAKAQFEKVKGNRWAWIAAIDQHNQSIRMNSLKAMRKKQGVSEEVEQIEEGRPSQQHPIEGHEYHKKSDAELRYIMKDAGAAAKAMKDHSPRAESKYLDQVNDASTVLSFRQRNGTPTWYKKKYGHVKESVDTPPFTPDAPKKNSGVVKGKRPEGMSKARHLARMAMRGELNKKKTVKEDSSNDIEKTNTPAKRTISKTTMIVKDAAKSSKDRKNTTKFESEPELSSQLVRNNF